MTCRARYHDGSDWIYTSAKVAVMQGQIYQTFTTKQIFILRKSFIIDVIASSARG